MKSIVCFLYVLFTVFYLMWAPDTYFWHGFNVITMILFSSACCVFVATKRCISENERLLFWYMFGVTSCRAIYTVFCIHANIIGRTEWKSYATHVFVIIVIATFFLFLIYLARQRE